MDASIQHRCLLSCSLGGCFFFVRFSNFRTMLPEGQVEDSIGEAALNQHEHVAFCPVSPYTSVTPVLNAPNSRLRQT